MTQHNKAVISNSAPTRVSPPGTHGGLDITVQNINSSGDIYIGDESVSSENYGFKLSPNQAFSIQLGGVESLYVIGSQANLSIATITFGLVN
jgi:hypothetical protein